MSFFNTHALIESLMTLLNLMARHPLQAKARPP